MPNFEVFTNRQTRTKGPTVTIGQRGVFTVSLPAYELLGRPSRVVFLFDPDTKIVGIKAAETGEQHAYAVSATGQSSFSISGGAFARHYRIPIGVAGAAWRRSAAFKDGILQFDLNEIPTQVTSNRAKKEASE